VRDGSCAGRCVSKPRSEGQEQGKGDTQSIDKGDKNSAFQDEICRELKHRLLGRQWKKSSLERTQEEVNQGDWASEGPGL
jgi:hypothetical protein